MVLLSIGLAYLHRSMQRQCENRHMQALQAIAFLFEYYDARLESPENKAHGEQDDGSQAQTEREQDQDQARAERQQEAEFNVGRSFHHLGLAHLAVPYYYRCLEISDAWRDRGGIGGDLKWEAAYMLQMVYITSGNPQMAMEVAERWLVI